MENNSVPKNDFAPAWLKVPQNDTSTHMLPKSYVGNQVEQHHEKPGRHSRWDGYHSGRSNATEPDSTHQRHYSFDNHYTRRTSQESNQEGKDWRTYYHHHSLDSESSDYSDSSNHSTPNRPADFYQHSQSRYWTNYGLHINSSPRRRTEQRDSNYKVCNNSGYHNGNHNQSQSETASGSRNSKWNIEDGTRENEEETLLNKDFPSLTRESTEEVKTIVNGGVWDNPPNSKVHSISSGRKIQLVQKSIKSDLREKGSNHIGNNFIGSSTSSSQKTNLHTAIINQNQKPAIQNQSNSSLYKPFVPSKYGLSKKNPKECLKLSGPFAMELVVNGSSASSSSKPPTPTSSFAPISFSKEALHHSPTPPLEILNTRFVTQPKHLSHKKSDFLKTLRSDQSKNDSGEENKNEDSEDDTAGSEVTIANKPQEDLNDMIDMEHLSIDTPERAILSSSLEAEQRLLREMGWKDEGSGDEAVYAPLTEDEMKEFEALTKKVQQRNGLTKTLPVNWSPKRMPFCTNPISIPNDTWTSSSDDSDSD